MNITLIATTIMGFESTLAREIKALGFTEVRVFDTKVEFDGQLSDICKANFWLRSAGRVYIKVAQFEALTFESLFEQTKAINWGDWIQKDDQFPISNVMCRKSVLFSRTDCQRLIKKAIVERLRITHKCQELPETNAVFPIRVQIENDIVTLSIDTSGIGLNKRGYRAHMDTAPIRETLAAGLILLSHWNPERDMLMDPLCGTGTLLIEAGLIAKNIAPGLNREFNSDEWSILPAQMWEDAETEAKDLIKHDATYRICGSDISDQAIDIAKKNISLAGLSDIVVEKKALSDISSDVSRGKIVTNPPYGERLDEVRDAEALYKEMGKVFKREIPDWSYYIITPNEQFERLFGEKATKRRKLYNGGIKCWFYQYFGKRH
ncbi:MAG: class I SAM-dependent RNA methyltransferase [bacterium]|nr:class I SAM-dependent RNA methyltransferase [bacterium]